VIKRDITLGELRNRLFERGLSLGVSTRFDLLDILRSKTGAENDAVFFEVYREFDGFEEADQRSYIKLWSTEEVLREHTSDYGKKRPDFIAIGDFLIGSDFIMYNMQQDKLYMLHDSFYAGDNLYDFLVKLTNGDFDRF